MRQTVAILILVFTAIVLQSALIPAFVPKVLQPDLFLLAGMCAVAFGAAEFGFTALFALGIAADLIGTTRLGLSPLCYLLAAGAILRIFPRELTRGDMAAVWVGGIVATIPAHILLVALGAVFGQKLEWGVAAGKVASVAISACFWGLPVVYLTGSMMFKLRVMSPQVQARWMNDERTTEVRRQVT